MSTAQTFTEAEPITDVGARLGWTVVSMANDWEVVFPPPSPTPADGWTSPSRAAGPFAARAATWDARFPDQCCGSGSGWDACSIASERHTESRARISSIASKPGPSSYWTFSSTT